MDLSQSITISRPGQAALDINSVRDPRVVGTDPLSGYSIERVDYSSVSVTAFTENLPAMDGIDSYDPYLSARQINMLVNVYGSTHADFWDKVNALNAALQAMPQAADTGTYPALPVDGRRKLSFKQDTTATGTHVDVDGYYNLYMLVRPAALPRFNVEKSSASGANDRGYATRFTISLIAEDPYRYFSATQTVSRTGAGTISITNRGTAVAWPVVVWGSGGTTSVRSVSLSGQVVSHTTGTTAITDTFKLATSTDSATLSAYTFFSIPPGTSTITVAGPGTVSITIAEAFI